MAKERMNPQGGESDKAWWNGWWSPPGAGGGAHSIERGKQTSRTSGSCQLPMECDPSVDGLGDSTVRFVDHPSGMDLQVNSSAPRGVPRVSLHQNHYAAILAPGSTLGAVQMGARDDTTASLSAFVDGAWSAVSHPTGLAMRVTMPGSTVPRYPAFTMRADGRVALGGGPTALSNSQVSLGVYRPGIMQLPSVEHHTELLGGSSDGVVEPFVNGAIVYARDLDRVLISQGGEWHAILTLPLSQVPKPIAALAPALADGGWGVAAPPPTLRSMGAPRKDGKPAVFGPRSSA